LCRLGLRIIGLSVTFAINTKGSDNCHCQDYYNALFHNPILAINLNISLEKGYICELARHKTLLVLEISLPFVTFAVT
jgi:hypothetical protein